MTEAIKSGDTIAVDYTGKLENGEVFDTSEGKTPLTFTVGAGMLIKGFDDAVMGMKKGESKTVTIPPEMGYGPRNDEAIVEIPREHIPEEIPLQEGIQLQLQDPQGRPVPATVAEITDEMVKMDVNHFLAGKTLVFDITIADTGLEPPAHACGCSAEDCGDKAGDCGSGCGGGCH
ncbi:MAG TPA: peptidylprolyl isomerase [Desulfobacteraceae bacterium]|nr:peptidylprolyl isomerase [Desulfobacteraceae bacterium]